MQSKGQVESRLKHALGQMFIMMLKVEVEMDRSSQILKVSSTFVQVLALL